MDPGAPRTVTSEDCYRRASQCAANAAVSPTEAVVLEFLRLSVQWRAMAVSEIFLAVVDLPVQPPVTLNAVARLSS